MIDTKSKSFRIMMGFFAFVLTMAIMWLIIGLTHSTEPGFLPNPPHWAHEEFPLTLCPASTQAMTVDDAAALRSAVQITNQRLGFTAFAMAPSEWVGTCTIPVDFTANGNCPAEGGATDINTQHGEPDVQIHICAAGDAELQGLVIQHELGHALGLAHDSPGDDVSIMHPEQRHVPNGEFPPRISDHDREIIRAAYGPRN